MVNLIRNNEKVAYNQIIQKLPILFSFLNQVGEDTYKQMFVPVMCRDYLPDAVFCIREKVKQGVFGFHLDGAKEKLDEFFLMSLDFPTHDSINRFKQNLPLLNKLEQQNNVIPTTYEEVADLTLIVKSDPLWYSKSPYVSMITWLYKVISQEGAGETIVNHCKSWKLDCDGRFLHQEHNYFEPYANKLTKWLEDIFILEECGDVYHQFNPKDGNLASLHNTMGFVATMAHIPHIKSYEIYGHPLMFSKVLQDNFK